MQVWDYTFDFEYQRERYNGYSIGKIILDLRTNFVEVETLYHQSHKNTSRVIKHGFNVEGGDVDIDALLNQIHKMHI